MVRVRPRHAGKIAAGYQHPVLAPVWLEEQNAFVVPREFLAAASAFGASAATTYAMPGLPAPAQAAVNACQGCTGWVQMDVTGPKDPRFNGFAQVANVSRGWLEHLVQFNNDATFEGKLLGG